MLLQSPSQHGCPDCSLRPTKSIHPSRYLCLDADSMTGPFMAGSASSQHLPSLGHTVPSGELNLPELELMVQWCTDTYRSISHKPSVEWIWHAAVPREAMRHPFLLHGLLAVSALHLSFRSAADPQAQAHYRRTAHVHQQHAQLGLSKAAHALDSSNCIAAFAVSSILIVCTFAQPLASPSPPPTTTTTTTTLHSPLDELCRIFQLTQRSTALLAEIIDWVARSDLHALVASDGDGDGDAAAPRMPDTSRLAIMALARTNVRLAMQSPRHDKPLFDRAIDALGRSLDQLARGGELLLSAFRWIVQLPPPFVDLLRARHPFALVILAHYAVVLHVLRARWWVGDWGERVIRAVGRQLDAEWRVQLGWVLDATGCYLPQ